MENVNIASYGYVAMIDGVQSQKDFGLVLDSRFLQLKSLGAELMACLRAIEWAIANNYAAVRIHYDCEGIIHALQSKRPHNDSRKEFVDLFEKYSNHVRILFRKDKNTETHRISHHLCRMVPEVVT